MIRFATIGTNFIVDKFIAAAGNCRDVQIQAVYSRTGEKALQFAQKHGIKRIFTDLNELAKDKEIDAVYIASPNSCHFEQSVLMLKNGKHVLCEKTIASNSKELQIMLKTARENRVILLEAMRNVFDPGFSAIKSNLEQLGKIRQVNFRYCQYSSRYDNFKAGIIENAFKPELSNGAMTDIGVYCIHPLVKLFSMPEKITAHCIKLHNGVDAHGTVCAMYPDMIANLTYSKIVDDKTPSTIVGEDATMYIDEITNPCNVSIQFRNKMTKTVFTKVKSCNLIYEIEEFTNLITFPPTVNPHNIYSLQTIALCDEIKEQCSILLNFTK